MRIPDSSAAAGMPPFAVGRESRPKPGAADARTWHRGMPWRPFKTLAKTSCTSCFVVGQLLSGNGFRLLIRIQASRRKPCCNASSEFVFTAAASAFKSKSGKDWTGQAVSVSNHDSTNRKKNSLPELFMAAPGRWSGFGTRPFYVLWFLRYDCNCADLLLLAGAGEYPQTNAAKRENEFHINPFWRMLNGFFHLRVFYD